MNPVEVFKAYMDRINAGDADGLIDLMTEDHVYIDSDGSRHGGLDEMRKGWAHYFSMFPDYWVRADHVFQDGNQIVGTGHAGGTYAPDGRLRQENKWEVTIAWRALIRDERVTEWQIYVNVEKVLQIVNRVNDERQAKD